MGIDLAIRLYHQNSFVILYKSYVISHVECVAKIVVVEAVRREEF